MLNIAELLTDPDFCSTFTRKRATLALANEGIGASSYDSGTTLVGITEPAKQADLFFLPEGTRLVDVIRVYTKADVRIGDKGLAADALTVDGVKYLALHVVDYSKYGFIQVLAQRLAA